MTCFWDALRSKLNIKSNNEEFIIYLKKNNKKPTNVICNNETITDKQFSQYIYMLMSYNRGEIDLFFNDKGHLDFLTEEEQSNEEN